VQAPTAQHKAEHPHAGNGVAAAPAVANGKGGSNGAAGAANGQPGHQANQAKPISPTAVTSRPPPPPGLDLPIEDQRESPTRAVQTTLKCNLAVRTPSEAGAAPACPAPAASISPRDCLSAIGSWSLSRRPAWWWHGLPIEDHHIKKMSAGRLRAETAAAAAVRPRPVDAACVQQPSTTLQAVAAAAPSQVWPS